MKTTSSNIKSANEFIKLALRTRISDDICVTSRFSEDEVVLANIVYDKGKTLHAFSMKKEEYEMLFKQWESSFNTISDLTSLFEVRGNEYGR